MSVVTHRVTTPDTGNTPNTSGAFVPALGDLLVVFAVGSDTTTATATLSSSVGTTFTQVNRTIYANSTYSIYTFIANQLVTNIASQTVTFDTPGDVSSGSVISVYSVSQMWRTGIDALKQVAEQENQAAGGTPAPAFSSACSTNNPTLGAIGNQSNPAGLQPPTDWSEGGDSGHGAPATGLETIFRNFGFSGTTITWGTTSATIFGSTIIELNADPNSPQIFPSFIPPKSSIGLASLTIAVNLLQTTLAPVQDPFFQNDWPNPQPIKQQPINFVRFYNPTELETGEKPFKQDDWPNPAPVKSQLLVNISSVNKNEDPIGKSEWKVPELKRTSALSWINNNLQDTLAPVETAPFIPADLSNPLIKKANIVGWAFSQKLEDAPDKFTPVDYPNPLIGRRNDVGWVYPSIIEVDEQDPFYQTNWPNPEVKKKGQDWIQNRPQYYEDEPTRFSQEFRNPDRRKEQTHTWLNNNLQNTIAPIITDVPKGQNDWPVPSQKGSLIVHISSSVHIEPTEKPQNSQLDWPNPIRKKILALTWLQERDQYLQDIKPFKQDQWPNPEPFKKPAITFIHNRKIDEPPEINPFVNQYANPIILPRNYQAHIQNMPYVLNTIKPVGSSDQVLPLPRIKGEVISWIQPRPYYYIESIADPFRQVNWPNPAGVKSGLIVNISSRYPEPAQTQKPFNQNDWPNPVLRVKRGMGWLDYFIYDSNEPPIAQSTTLPLVKKIFDASFIKSALITSTGSPIKTFDYPNPVIIERHIHSHIDNLLQKTLDPGVGETPFNQHDYPNPTLANKIRESGWVWDKRFYYTEEPLIPAQYDWPIFRPTRRNDVSLIIYRIGTSEPPTVTVADVPIRFGTKALTWLDNPILVLNTPAVTEIPFRQIDWPLFRSVRSARDIFTVIGQNPQILPQIVGRVICLLADDTEYFVEVTEKNHEYDVRVTEYGIEVGGKECQ